MLCATSRLACACASSAARSGGSSAPRWSRDFPPLGDDGGGGIAARPAASQLASCAQTTSSASEATMSPPRDHSVVCKDLAS